MLRFFYVNRSIRDARGFRDVALYLVKYTPAACFVTYVLMQQLQGRFSIAATFVMALAMVVFGVEVRMAIRRRIVRDR